MIAETVMLTSDMDLGDNDVGECASRLRGEDSNPYKRDQNPLSYH